MARVFLIPIDMSKNEIQNAVFQNLTSNPSSPVEGQYYWHTTDNKLKIWDGAAWVELGAGGGSVTSVTATSPLTSSGGATPDIALNTSGARITNTHIDDAAAIAFTKLATPGADFGFGGFKITNLGDPSTGTDAANKQYVDNAINGLAWKEPVRAATTANGTLATAFENGDTIDGVALATGNRILLKDQTAPEENGIYVVAASGAPTRATDADSAADVDGAAVFVNEGTVNSNTSWTMTTNLPITLGTTGLVWSQFGGPGEYVAGTGLTKTGNSFALTVPVAIANGGTNATTPAAALANLGGISKFSVNIGDNSSTSIAVTHNLGTRAVTVEVFRNSTPWDTVICDVERNSTTQVTLKFTVAPTTDQFTVVVTG